MGRWRNSIGVFAILIFLGPTALAQSDTEPPVLADFDFDPKSVDVTTDSAEVMCTMTLSDSPAGVNDAVCSFHAPGNQSVSCDGGVLVSGDASNGVWECTAIIPQYAEEGIWTARVRSYDTIGNLLHIQGDEIDALGFPSQLDVISQSDTEPPVLADFDFDPKSVDVTTDSAEVMCTMTLSDSPAGVNDAVCSFHAPGNQSVSCDGGVLVSGDASNGVWECTAIIPQYAEEGIWTARVRSYDTIGNLLHIQGDEIDALGFPSQLDVISQSDTEPPVLADFDFDPKSVDVTTDSAEVMCTMTLSDSPAGVNDAVCSFHAPGNQSVSCDGGVLVSGDASNGVWECTAIIPQYAEEGIWTARVRSYDTIGNLLHIQGDEIDALGFPSQLGVGFANGQPLATIAAPQNGARIRGNSVTIRARLIQGSPGDVSPTLGVRFDFRALPFGDFAPIPARNVNHPNPDTTFPYFVHWDVSGVAGGEYELRAVAHDLDGTPDPSPEAITITIDHGGPVDVDENENASGHQESRTAVDDAVENEAESGDHVEASTATQLIVPAGALTFATDTAVLVHVDAADEIARLEQPEQNVGSFVDVSLESGQTDFEGGATSELNISYSDRDMDGVVDGTTVREDELELRRYDAGSDSYLLAPGWIVLTEHNMVHADTAFVGKFALAGPLLPRIWIDAGKETLTWDVVSTASSYTVYRGLLSELVDTDADGLPDAGYGDCMNHLDIDPTDVVFVDSENPPENEGFFYIVGFVGPEGAAGLGNTSSGMRREPLVVCP